jgi:hypothetical protein
LRSLAVIVSLPTWTGLLKSPRMRTFNIRQRIFKKNCDNIIIKKGWNKNGFFHFREISFHENFHICKSFCKKCLFLQKFCEKFSFSLKFLQKILFSQKFSQNFFAKTKIFARVFIYGKGKFFCKKLPRKFYIFMSILVHVFGYCLICFETPFRFDLTVGYLCTAIKRLSHLFWNRSRIC